MKADAKAAVAALNVAKAATHRHSVVSARGAVKITAANGVATMEAADGEIGVRRIFAATDAVDITALIDATRLAKALSVMKGEITFTQGDGTGLTISAGKRKVDLPGERLEDFHAFPYADGVPIITTDATLADAITRVAPFAGTDATRPVLTGVAIDHSGALVATNSYMLGVIPCAGVDGEAVKRIAHDGRTLNIPVRAWTLAAKAMKGATSVMVTHAGFMVTISAGDTTWTARVIDGTFPNWSQLIPDTFEVVATLAGSADLHGSAVAANKLLNPKSPMRLSLDAGLTVRAHDHTGINMSETIPAVVTYASGAAQWDAEWGCSPDYVADVMASLGGGEITLSLISPVRPGLFESAAGRALLMPIRLDS